MELRHLRYFVAVAEEGSLNVAAEKRLHTAQPSLSRQMRHLESEVGFQLLIRSVRGIQLTEAGRKFLDHARLVLAQVDTMLQATRLAAQPARPTLSVGILVGHELDCLPATTAILQNTMPTIELRIFSNFSTMLAADLLRGTLDLAFLRREPEPDLEYRLVEKEELVLLMPRKHRLRSRKVIKATELAGEKFIGVSEVPRVLRKAVMDYLKQEGVDLVPHLAMDSFSTAISLVESENAVAIMPASILSVLPPTVVSRRFKGKRPTVDLVAGFRKGNDSPILLNFLSKFDELTSRIRNEAARYQRLKPLRRQTGRIS
jgi:LysR family transcriptional regulator, hca operon transcriptional activator